MSIFAFICPYKLLIKKKVTFCQLFSHPGPSEPYVLRTNVTRTIDTITNVVRRSVAYRSFLVTHQVPNRLHAKSRFLGYVEAH